MLLFQHVDIVPQPVDLVSQHVNLAGGLGGVMVRVLAFNLGGRRLESWAGDIMLESW